MHALNHATAHSCPKPLPQRAAFFHAYVGSDVEFVIGALRELEDHVKGHLHGSARENSKDDSDEQGG